MANVRFVDHSDIVLRQMGQNIRAAADNLAELAVEAIQTKMLYGYKDVHGNPPHTEIVDTGALFDSVDAEVKRASQNGFTVQGGAGTSYAKYVHDGTYKLKGRPFVTDGLMEAKPEIQSELVKSLSNGF